LDELHLLEERKRLIAARFQERADAELTGGLLKLLGPPSSLTAAWLREVVDRLAVAVAEEADAAARAAQSLAAELGQACLRFERAESHRRLEAAREEAEEALAMERQTVARLRAQLERAESGRGDASPGQKSQDERKRTADVPKYASMIVSEIKRYYEAGAAGVPDGNISERIRSEIERCRRLSSGRVPAEAHSARTALDDGLFELLGGDNVEAEGRVG
jgi:hypothetical protein